MKSLFRWLTVLCVLVLAAACQDATLPSGNPPPDLTEVYTEAEYTCCDEVIVIVPGPDPGCDVWWKPECDQCAESVIGSPEDVQTTSGCGGGGGGSGGGDPSDPGGGGGGGGGGGTPGNIICDPAVDPDCGSPPPTESSLANDMARDTLPPDCGTTGLTQWQDLYCNRATAPDSAQRQATAQALDAIAARGGECAAIAQVGRDLLANGRITFFVWQQGDAGGYGHRNTGIQLDEAYARLYGTTGSTFERTLVHEIDHFLGNDHTDAAGLVTAHSGMCG